MKLLKSIKLIGGALLFSSGVLMTSCDFLDIVPPEQVLSLIHISEPTRQLMSSRMPSSA